MTKRTNFKISHSYIPNHNISFINPFSYLKLRMNPHATKGIDFFMVDGGLLVKYLSIFGLKTKRASFDMTSLAPQIFETANTLGASLYIVGSDHDSISIFVEKIRNKYPHIKISGYRNGFFSSTEERSLVLNEINSIAPSFVIVGMGTPLQELFLTDLRETGWKGTGFTCGGFIHQTAMSATLQYYPAIINKLKLRWLYRMYREPNTIRRYFFIYPLSLLIIPFDVALKRFHIFTAAPLTNSK